MQGGGGQVNRQLSGPGGIDNQLVLLRPPPNNRNQGSLGSITDLIDIDYETLVLLLGVAGAGASWALYQTILTKGRRSFGLNSLLKKSEDIDDLDKVADFVNIGLEEFEEKVNSWGEHEEANVDETGWIGNILKEFAKVKKDVEEEVINVEEEATHDNHDIEPPLLDPKWGLAADPESPSIHEDKETKLSKRSTSEDATLNMIDGVVENLVGGDSCRLGAWRCVSGVMEGGVKFLDKPAGLWSLAKKALYKIAFHGGVTDMWSSLMTIPEARSITRCMKEHDKCVAEQIVAEAAEMRGKGRYIVNTEFLGELDTSDGADQYDQEEMEEQEE